MGWMAHTALTVCSISSISLPLRYFIQQCYHLWACKVSPTHSSWPSAEALPALVTSGTGWLTGCRTSGDNCAIWKRMMQNTRNVKLMRLLLALCTHRGLTASSSLQAAYECWHFTKENQPSPSLNCKWTFFFSQQQIWIGLVKND